MEWSPRILALVGPYVCDQLVHCNKQSSRFGVRIGRTSSIFTSLGCTSHYYLFSKLKKKLNGTGFLPTKKLWEL